MVDCAAFTGDMCPGRLLCVDDEPPNLSALKRLFRHSGYHIRTARGGEEALALLENEAADVILSDLRMPSMDGTTFLAETARRWPESRRILVTAFGDVDAITAAVNEGRIHSFVHKPWDPRQLPAMVRNAMEHGRALRRLRESQACLRSLLDTLPDPVFFLDAQGVFRGGNRAFEDYARHDCETLKGLSWQSGALRDKLAPLVLKDPRAFAEGGRVRHEDWVQYSGGRRVLLDVIETPFYAGDSFLGTVGVCRDITARSRMEADLRQAKQTAEAANSAKSDFLRNMSHELRTPLNAVLGAVSLLRASNLDPEQQELVDTAASAGGTLLELIDAVLGYSRQEKEDEGREQAEIDLPSVVQAATDKFADPAGAKGLALNWEIDADLAPRMCGKMTGLQQVLHHLLSNAVKFTTTGSITVNVGQINGSALRFEVADTGPGIADADQVRLFDAFTQADGSITRGHGGTGLGLAICLQTVEDSGGELGVESTVGEGSRFWFTWPVVVARHD